MCSSLVTMITRWMIALSHKTHLIYIGMPDFGEKLERRRAVRIVWRELESGLYVGSFMK